MVKVGGVWYLKISSLQTLSILSCGLVLIVSNMYVSGEKHSTISVHKVKANDWVTTFVSYTYKRDSVLFHITLLTFAGAYKNEGQNELEVMDSTNKGHLYRCGSFNK